MPWLHLAHDALRDGGCAAVRVVLGAAADEAARLVPPGAQVVVAAGWQRGQGASLAAGLAGLPPATDVVAVVVTLVDLPDLDDRAVRRVTAAPVGPGDLRRATFGRGPAHPVLIGRDHWEPLRRGLHGDTGARDYLRAHPPAVVDCADLPGGQDRDVPA